LTRGNISLLFSLLYQFITPRVRSIDKRQVHGGLVRSSFVHILKSFEFGHHLLTLIIVFQTKNNA